MAPCIFGSRLRYIAALTLVFGVVVGQSARSQDRQYSDDNSAQGGTTVADGEMSNFSGASFNGGCQGDYTSGACNGSCNCEDGPGFDDGYKHYFPIWLGAEWIYWRLDGNRLPPLVTDGPATPPQANVARLDDSGTRILSGGDTVNDSWRSGFRVFGGYWIDCCRTCGIGVDFFDVGNDPYKFTSEPDPNRVVGRPFFNTELGQDDVEFVSVPNELDGTVHVSSNDDFKGAGITFNRQLWRCCDPCSCSSGELNFLGGYRFYQYDTSLTITENLTVLPGTTTPLVPGTTFFVQDRFRTHNEFNGGEIGFQGCFNHSCWLIDGTAKVALGEQHRTVTVNGQTITVVPGGGSATADGGLLTSGLTNIGRYDDSDFAIIPEFRLGVGAQLTHYCSVRVGYNLIVWNDVARAASHLPPGLQVDPRNLPPVQAGGGPEPEFPGIHGSQLLAHGLDLGVMFQF